MAYAQLRTKLEHQDTYSEASYSAGNHLMYMYESTPPRHTQRAMHSLALERLPVMMAAYQEAARMGYLQSSTNVDATQVLTCGARKIFARSWSIARCLHSLLASFSLTTAFT